MNPYYALPNLDIAAMRLVNGLESAVRRSVDGISRWRRRRTTIRAFQALSHHLLTDIGLDRSQIVSTVEDIIETDGQTVARIVSRKHWES